VVDDVEAIGCSVFMLSYSIGSTVRVLYSPQAAQAEVGQMIAYI
jgi:hypothetical protein